MGVGEKPQEPENRRERSFLKPDEFVAAMRALSEIELTRLQEKAKYRALGSGMEGDDLFQEAIRRTLEEDEWRCPSDVPVPIYLDNAMRSIADGERRKYVRERPAGAGQSDEDKSESNLTSALSDPAPSPSDTALARIELREVLEALEQMFADDPEAQAVIMGDGEGWSADEIKDLSNMDDKHYAAARKRVRRGLTKKFGIRGRP
jgi:DNA-directed RNA polymerase specialized sigma24 family protein